MKTVVLTHSTERKRFRGVLISINHSGSLINKKSIQWLKKWQPMSRECCTLAMIRTEVGKNWLQNSAVYKKISWFGDQEIGLNNFLDLFQLCDSIVIFCTFNLSLNKDFGQIHTCDLECFRAFLAFLIRMWDIFRLHRTGDLCFKSRCWLCRNEALHSLFNTSWVCFVICEMSSFFVMKVCLSSHCLHT